MKKFMSVLLALLLVIMVAGGGVLPQATAVLAGNGVQVSINAPAEVLQGSNFTATVNISQVIDLSGAQYEILFDPFVLAVDNVTAGQIGSTEMPVQGFTEISPGRCRVLQSLILDKVSGSGYLAVLHFHAIASLGNSTPINLSNGILSGWEAEIPASWFGASVHVLDITLPTVTTTSPTANATDVAIDTTIQVTFSEAMNKSSVESAFSLPSVSGNFTWADNTTTFTPDYNLAYGTTYTVNISTTARDLAGNPLAEAYIWSFTTVPLPQLVSIAVTPSAPSIALGQTQQFTANGTYQFGTANITADVTWDSSNASVATINTTGQANPGLATGVAVGTTVITASLVDPVTGLKTSPGVTLTVTPGPVDHIVLSPSIATITTDETKAYTVTAFDAYGNSWAVTAETTFSINATAGGSWVANVYTPQKAGDWIVTGTHTPSGKTATAILTVRGGAIIYIVLSPSTATIAAGDTQAYAVEAYDAVAQHWDVTAETTFSINATAGGSWLANVYTAEKAGTWTVTGTHTPSGKTATATLIVTPGAITSIVLSPHTAPIIAAGDNITYGVLAYDKRGNFVDYVCSITTFSINITAGGSWAANVYTAQKAGIWTVKGTYQGLTDTDILTVTPGAITSIVLSPATTIIDAGASQTYTVAASDNYTNSWNVTASTTFSINTTAGGSWAANVYTSETTGTWTVTGTHTPSGKTATAKLSVRGGAITSIVLSPSTANITADNTQAYTVEASDQPGNRWDVTIETTFTINTTAGGSWLANVYTAGKVSPPGTPWTVKGTHTGGKFGTANLTVTVGALHHVVLSPKTATIIAGGTQNYTVEAFDKNNNTQGYVCPSTNFAIQTGAGGSWATNVYTAQKAGTWTVTGNYSGKTDTATLMVNVAPLDHIVLSPSTATITADQTQKYNAAACDAYTNSWDVTAGTTFSIQSGAGGSWAANVYTADKVGTWTVTGNYTGKTATATLTVTLGALYRIEVSPATANVSAGYTTNFTAYGFDQRGNAWGDITTTCTWSSSHPGIASVQSKGEANPGQAKGYTPGAVTITAAKSGISGKATLTVTEATISSIAVTPANATITVNATQAFRAMATKSDGSKIEVTTTANWSSNNTAVADNPVVSLTTSRATTKGMVVGTVTITATYGGKSGTSTLTVIAVPLVSIEVTPTTPTVARTRTQQFFATGNYSGTLVDLTNFVNWSSSNNATAGIVSGGLATSYAAGTTVIIATSGNISGNTTLIVIPAVPDFVVVTPITPTITFVSGTGAAPTIQFKATAVLSDGTATDNTSTANWTSSTLGVATMGADNTTAAGLATTLSTAITVTTNITANVSGVVGTTTLTVLPDTIAPVVSLTSPADGLVTNKSTLTISGSVDDVHATANVTINDGVAILLTVDNVTGFFSTNVTLNNGYNNIVVRAVDGVGNVGISGARTVLVDARKPNITITSPAEGFVTKNPIVTVNGTIADSSSTTLRVNGKVVATFSGSGNFSASVTLSPGRNNIIASGFGAGGTTEGYHGTSGARTVILDTTKPVVDIISPASGSTFNFAGITVNGTVDDKEVSTANLTLSNSSGIVSQIVPVSGGRFSQDVKLEAGSNTITVWATDNNSNASLITSVTVKYDNTAPEITITAPTTTNKLLTNVGGQLVSGNISDPSITTATVIVNGSSRPIDVAPDGSFSTMVSLTPGIVNKIEVTARDKAGNEGTSGVINVTFDNTPPVVTIGLSDPTDSMLITVTSKEALVAIPTVSVNATGVTMTQLAGNQWTGNFIIPAPNTYTVTANGTDLAGNPTTTTAVFSKETVTIDADVPVTVVTGTTTLVIDTTENVTGQSISVTQHTENPAENTASEIESGIFIEINASANLTNSIQSVNITVAYDVADILARGIVESTLKLYLWSTTSGTWEPVPGSAANTTAHYVYGTVTHFSKYGAFGTTSVAQVVQERPPTVVIISPGIIDVSQVVAANGAFTIDVTAKSVDTKVKLTINQNTIGKTNAGIALSRLSILVIEPPALPVNASIVGLTYDLGPNGATFTPPITLTFTYDPTKIPQGVLEKDLYLAYWDGTKWVAVVSTVDTTAKTVTAKISRFAAFTIIAPAPPVIEALAAFTVSDLSISPAEVNIGESVTISARVTNTGNLSGTYKVTLKIDGVEVETKEGTLAGGASQTVTFTTSKDVAGTYTVTVDGQSGTFTVKALPEEEVAEPAAFTVSGLSISPAEVNIGESVTISALVKNTGDLSGTYTVTLKINNVVVDTKEGTLAGGASQTVTFTTSKDVAGTYTVNVDGQSGTFTVKALPEEEVLPKPIPGWVWLIVGLAVVAVIGAAIWLVLRRRRV